MRETGSGGPGGTMKKREWLSLFVLALAAMAAMVVGIKTIYITGVDGERLMRPETKELLREVFFLFAIACGILSIVKDRKIRWGCLVLEASVFMWLHQAFLPVVISGLYLVVIIGIGRLFRGILDKEKRFSSAKTWSLDSETYFDSISSVDTMADFTLGSVALILLYCLMSLAGIGSIPATRVAAVVLGAVSCLPISPWGKRWIREWKNTFADRGEQRTWSLGMAAMAAFIFAMVLLQVGRMNICADYDSLHYGLRSEYVLNDGGGIYENLGSINVVYTYSKGLETLLLPISGLPSYSVFLSFQMWMTVGILLAAGEVVKLFVSVKDVPLETGVDLAGAYAWRQADTWAPMLCMTILAAIPGIMNMGITAKTDSATALFQLVMAYYLLLFVRKGYTGYFAVAGCAFLLTMVLKPTALVFSTILAGTVFVFLFVTRTFKINWKDRFLLSWIPAIVMWLLIWLRTLMLTGLPVTSVFTSIWTKLGFTVKYPFKFDSMPSNGGDGLKAAIKHFLKRLYGVLLAPVGDDMAHVRIAWGTCILFVFLVLFLIVFVVRTKRVEEQEKRPIACLAWMFVTNGLMSLLALYLLWQVDGNYFILMYCFFAILGTMIIGRLESPWLQRGMVLVLLPILVFNVSITAVSNWDGTLGLSPVKAAHKGYYDHWAEAKEDMIRKGNKEIWNILAEDPQTRVLVYGSQPEMLMFPCNAQSYTDIEGSGGNYYVPGSMRSLVDYFTYAKIDYVYFCGGYLKPGTVAWKCVVEMMESGHLTDIFYENGNGLARFMAEPVISKDVDDVLEEFSQCYWPGEQQ